MYDIKYKTKEIFSNLKDYVESKSIYSPHVRLSSIKLDYPVVIFTELSNQRSSKSVDQRQTIRSLSFQIDIYTVDVNSTNSRVIADELKQLVVELLEDYYNLSGGYSSQISNINTAKATQTILRYNCDWYMEKNIIL